MNNLFLNRFTLSLLALTSFSVQAMQKWSPKKLSSWKNININTENLQYTHLNGWQNFTWKDWIKKTKPTWSAGGILPYYVSKKTGKSYFLIGKDEHTGTWCDCGGQRDFFNKKKVDKSLIKTAIREANEESRGAFNFDDQMTGYFAGSKSFNKNGSIFYGMFLVEVKTKVKPQAILQMKAGKHAEKNAFAWVYAKKLYNEIKKGNSTYDLSKSNDPYEFGYEIDKNNNLKRVKTITLRSQFVQSIMHLPQEIVNAL